MFKKWFGKKSPPNGNKGNNNNRPEPIEEIKVEKTKPPPKKKPTTKRKQRKPRKDSSVTLPKIGYFEDGKDKYGNVEDFTPQITIKVSMLEDLVEANLLSKVVGYLQIKEVVPMSLLNKRIQLGLRDTPLRLDSLKKLIPTRLMLRVGNNVKFSDDSESPQWHVSGLITQVDLTQLFNTIDPAKLDHLGIIIRQQKNITPIGARCTNLTQLDLQDCPELIDISPLSSLTNLKALLIFKALKLTDISPLSSLNNLKALNLRSCEVLTDIAPLAACTSMKRLAITTNSNITDFTAIRSMPDLEILDLTLCSKLKDLNCLPDSDFLEVLILSGCESLENVDWFDGHANNLKMLKINECRKVTDLSSLRDANDLISLNVSGLIELTGLDSIKGCAGMKHFESVNCFKLANMAEVFAELKALEAVKLEQNVCLKSEDGKALLQCEKMIHLDVLSCRTVFLAELFASNSIVFLNAAKAAIKVIFSGNVIRKYQREEAVSLVEAMLADVDYTNKANQQTAVSKLTQLLELMKEVKSISYGVVASPSFMNMWKAIVAPETPELLRNKLLEFFHDTISFDRHSSLKLVEEPELFKCFLALIDRGSNDKGLTFTNVGLMSIKIVSKFLECLRRVIYESRRYVPKDFKEESDHTIVDNKPSPLVVLNLMLQSVQEIQNAGVIEVLLNIMQYQEADKEHVSSCFELIRNYIQVVHVVNDIGKARGKLSKTINNEFVLEPLVVSPKIAEHVIPVLVKTLWDIEEESQLDAVTLLMLLVDEGGEQAAAILLEDTTLPLKLLEHIFLSAFKFLGNSKDNDLAKEATTRCIENGTLLLKHLDISKFVGIFEDEAKALKLIITMLETNNDLMQVCIRDENDPANFNCIENINKFMFIKHINLLLECVGYITEKPENVDKIYAVAENLPGVIASLLHAASDQLDVFEKSALLVIELSHKSDVFCKKVQYLYTNSEVIIALRLFIDPKPQKRPRKKKTLEQKVIGLRLMLILTDSTNFCNKFLDHNGKEMKTFEKQFRRFVYQVQARDSREDYEGMKAAALFIGKLMSTESNSPAKVRKLIQSYISPLLDILSKIVTDRKTVTKALIKEEKEACEFDKKAEKISRERNEQQNNPLDLLLALTGFGGGGERVQYQRDSEAVVNYIFAAEEAPNTAEEPETQNDDNPLASLIRLMAQTNPGLNTAATQQLIRDVVSPAETILDKVHVLNWSFRICCFLSHLFSSGGYGALGVVDETVLRHVLWCFNESNTLLTPDPKLKRGVKILEGAAASLLSTIISQLISPKGRKLVSVEGHDLNVQEEEEETQPNQPQQPQMGLFQFLLTGNMFNRQDTARAQLEARKKVEAALVRTILTKQRQFRYVQKLCSDLIKQEESFEAQLGEQKVEAPKIKSSILSMPGKRAMIRVNRISTQIYESGTPLDKCEHLITNGEIPYVISSGFALFTSLCRVSALNNTHILAQEVQTKPAILDALNLNFAYLLESGDYIADFVRLLAHSSPDLTFQLLSGLIEKFTESIEKDQKNFCFLTSLFLLRVLDQSTAEGPIFKRVLGGDGDNGWLLPSKLASYLENVSAELTAVESAVAENILLILGVLLQENPLNLLNILEATGESGLAKFLVSTLLKDSGDTPVAQVALSLLQGFSTVDDGQEKKAVMVLSGKLLDEGLLEVLSKWKTADGKSANYEALSPYARALGLTAINIALSGDNYNDIATGEKKLVEQTLIDWLAKHPVPSVAKALVRLEPELENSQALREKFLGYELFEEALAREERTVLAQKAQGDIILERVRGFPHQMSLSRKYRVEFYGSRGTVAVHESFAARQGLCYFEVTVIKDRVKMSALSLRPFGSIGVVSNSFTKGILAGSLLDGVGEVSNTNTCGFSFGDEVKHNDVIGVLVNVEKSYVKFFKNGRKPIKQQVGFLSNGFLPAVSGQNIDFQINLGSTPFLYYRKVWTSFKEAC